jgi:hypothetical protein
MLINRKPREHEALTQEEVCSIGSRLEQFPHKCLAQKMGTSRNCKNRNKVKEATIIVYSLQLFHSGELDPKLALIFT